MLIWLRFVAEMKGIATQAEGARLQPLKCLGGGENRNYFVGKSLIESPWAGTPHPVLEQTVPHGWGKCGAWLPGAEPLLLPAGNPG